MLYIDPGGVHRLRRVRRGLPGRRLLRRGPAAGRVGEFAAAQRGVLRGQVARRRRRRGAGALCPGIVLGRRQPAIGRLIPTGCGAAAGDAGLQHRQRHRRDRDDPARGLADRLGGRVVGIGDHQRHAGVGRPRAAASSAAPCRAAARRARRPAAGRRPRRRSGSARRPGVVKPDMFSITPRDLELDLVGHLAPSGARPSAPSAAAS